MSSTMLRPLTKHAISELRRISRTPCPAQEINPGVSDRFRREGLVETIMLPSPYKTVKDPVAHYTVSEAGIAKLKEIDG